MAMDSLSTRSRGFSGSGRNVKRTSRWFGGLFWWTMLIILLSLAAVASWTFCVFAFSYPEKPINYMVLQKFNKLEAPKSFSNSNAPRNRSYEARDLYDRFNEYEDRHFKEINSLLVRNYIENFIRAERGFTMNMVGKFSIEARRALGEDDLITSGTVLMARCVDFPDVSIEYILPGKPGSVPEELLKVGDILDLGTKSRSRFAPFNVVLHVSRQESNLYCFCVVPIVYSKGQITRGVELTLAPPRSLNIKGVMPPIAVELKSEASDEEKVSVDAVPPGVNLEDEEEPEGDAVIPQG
ncbi:MAG: hypothetical protein ACI9UA_004606 [Pseudoalteromonas tetraodonis]|jgi:hypothetical protein